MKRAPFQRRAKDRSILHRNGSVAMAQGNRLKSTPLKPRSKKRAQLMREVRGPLVREILAERPWCQRCIVLVMEAYRRTSVGPAQRSTQVHEKLTRARGGDITDKANCVAVCRGCHMWIHDHPKAATDEGWLEHRVASIKILPRRY